MYYAFYIEFGDSWVMVVVNAINNFFECSVDCKTDFSPSLRSKASIKTLCFLPSERKVLVTRRNGICQLRAFYHGFAWPLF